MTDDRNRQTVAAYDDYAEHYAQVTKTRLPIGDEALDRFIGGLESGARVLEIASGPGWDADDMEARGLSVVRTDLSDGFIAVQRARGKTVGRLDLLADDLGGPWDGLAALYVLQHVARDRIEDVVARMAAAVRPGGLILTSFQEGEAELSQTGSEGGTYHVVQWPPRVMIDRFIHHGLERVWSRSFQGDEARWTLLIARRS